MNYIPYETLYVLTYSCHSLSLSYVSERCPCCIHWHGDYTTIPLAVKRLKWTSGDAHRWFTEPFLIYNPKQHKAIYFANSMWNTIYSSKWSAYSLFYMIIVSRLNIIFAVMSSQSHRTTIGEKSANISLPLSNHDIWKLTCWVVSIHPLLYWLLARLHYVFIINIYDA